MPSQPVVDDGVVIIGAGIMGCATAYYLTEIAKTEASKIHLVEVSPELFASASGKAAGFLASDWFGAATASLGALSFDLHKSLAAQHDGRRRWGYSRSTGTSLAHHSKRGGPRGDDWLRDGGSRANVAADHDFSGPSTGPAWLTRRRGDSLEVISTDESTGQVDPLQLSQFLLAESLNRGVELHQPAEVLEVDTNADGNLTGVTIRDMETQHTDVIACGRLLITAGAWTGKVFNKLFPRSDLDLQIGQLAGHSVVVESSRWTAEHEAAGCHAVFTTQPSGFSPEIFSRIGGNIYVAGLNDWALPLPRLATDAVPDEQSIEELVKVSQQLLGQDGTDVSDLKVLRTGLCFRPTTASGSPILSRIDSARLGLPCKDNKGGVYVSAGHGPWGISHSLGTGKVMAEMLEGLPLSANVHALQV